MNKLFVILLAVCLVSVHGLVKREADTANHNLLDDLQKQLQDISSNINGLVNPEQIKKGFNDVVDNLNKAVNDLKTKIDETSKKN